MQKDPQMCEQKKKKNKNKNKHAHTYKAPAVFNTLLGL